MGSQKSLRLSYEYQQAVQSGEKLSLITKIVLRQTSLLNICTIECRDDNRQNRPTQLPRIEDG